MQPPNTGVLAYDAVRKRSVLFVPAHRGKLSQTWLFDGGSQRWTLTTPDTNPPLVDAGVAFDAARGVVVLVGGTGGDSSCAAGSAAQTWTWDGHDWSQQHPATSPYRCAANHLVYDATRHQVLLLADDNAYGAAETWLWNGSTWKDAGPGPTSGASIAYDGENRRVFAFGGRFFVHGTFYLNRQFGWNGSHWIKLSIGLGTPGARAGAAMTADPLIQEPVLFGGVTSSYRPGIGPVPSVLNDTWRFENTRWRRFGPESSPPPMSGAAMVYDQAHRFVVLHGSKGTWILTTVRRGGGFVFCSADGGVFTSGTARFYGSAGAMHLNQPIVGIASTATRHGYWLVARDGGIFAFGDAKFYGSTGGIHLNSPIVGIARTPTRNGYWLVARDGGIFAFGDARYFGSTGGMHLNAPIVGMAATPTGAGYWLVGRDGGVYAFGDAHFSESEVGGYPGQYVGIASTPKGDGYWLVTRNGRVFSFGNAAWRYGGSSYPRPVVALLSSPHGNGFSIVTDNGLVRPFGDAPARSLGGLTTSPVVAATST